MSSLLSALSQLSPLNLASAPLVLTSLLLSEGTNPGETFQSYLQRPIQLTTRYEPLLAACLTQSPTPWIVLADQCPLTRTKVA